MAEEKFDTFDEQLEEIEEALELAQLLGWLED